MGVVQNKIDIKRLNKKPELLYELDLTEFVSVSGEDNSYAYNGDYSKVKDFVSGEKYIIELINPSFKLKIENYANEVINPGASIISVPITLMITSTPITGVLTLIIVGEIKQLKFELSESLALEGIARVYKI